MGEWSERRVMPGEEEAIAAFMRELSRLSVNVPDPPAADLVWVKAQLLKRWDAERKVQVPLDVMEPVQIAAGLLAAGLLLVWSVPALLRAASTTVHLLW